MLWRRQHKGVFFVVGFFWSNKSCFQGWYLIAAHSHRIIQVVSQGVAKWNTSVCDYFQEEEALQKRVCQRYSWHVGLCNHTHWPEFSICRHIQQWGFMGSYVWFFCSRSSDGTEWGKQNSLGELRAGKTSSLSGSPFSLTYPQMKQVLTQW